MAVTEREHMAMNAQAEKHKREALARKAAEVKAPAPEAPAPEAPAPEAPAPQAPAPGELSVDFLERPGILALSEEVVKATAPRNARSNQQQAMDKIVRDNHETWVRAGKPVKWADMIAAKAVATYIVTPGQVAGLKKLVGKACDLHRVRPRYGAPVLVTERLIKAHNLSEDMLGREIVSFAVLDKVSRERQSKVAQAAVGMERPST